MTGCGCGRQGPGLNVDEVNPEKDPTEFTREADHFSECVIEGKTRGARGGGLAGYAVISSRFTGRRG